MLNIWREIGLFEMTEEQLTGRRILNENES